MIALGAICLAYLLGAFPTGLLVGRWVGGVDIRRHGSGNVGATNVTRVIGQLPGLIVLGVDLAKGWLPVAMWAEKAHASAILLGMAAVAGHIWNPFLRFQGGKGVATGLGVLLALDWRVGLGCAVVWTAAVLWTRYVSVASSAAALAAPFWMVFWGLPISWVFGTMGVSLAILGRHRLNFLRLLQGEESRIGLKKNPKNP